MARIVAVAPDLMFASRIEATLGAAGHDVELADAIPQAGPAELDLLVLDLDRVEPGGAVGRGVPVLGFYSHTDVETRTRAEGAGVDVVVPRSRMAREMPALVDGLLT